MALKSVRKSGLPTDLSARKGKKKRTSTKRFLEAIARKSAKPVRDDHFDGTWTCSKQAVLGKKRRGGGCSVGLARSRAMEKRRKSLLKDYERSRKSSAFIDNRIGENNDELGEFDKGILRLQRERQKQETKKQVMEEIIAKSKFYKAQKAVAKEEDAHLMEQLDKKFTSLNQSNVFLPLRQQTDMNASKPPPGKSYTNSSVEKGLSGSAGKASMEEWFGDFDKLVRELPIEKRARPTDRTKSAEEIAEEERERLQLLEEERQRRMHATYDSDDEEKEDDDVFHKPSPNKSRHVSGDDSGDSLSTIEKLVDKTCQFDDNVSNVGSVVNRSSDDSQDDDDEAGSTT